MAHTPRLDVNDPASRERAVAGAAEIIRRGGLVAFPTETVYGLGANALDPVAVARIFEAKQRPLNDPLIVHIAEANLHSLADVDALRSPGRARRLMERFWPGPLTLVLPRGASIPPDVTAGLDKVAIRVPAHPIALALIRASGVPIAAPSANRFGHVSPTTAAHVLDDLDGRIDLVLDGGPTPIGVESTVLDLTAEPPVILRPGGVSAAEIEALVGPLGRTTAGPARGAEAMPSPGMLDKHYAPHARLAICRDGSEMIEQYRALTAQGRRVGLLPAGEQRGGCADLLPQFDLGDDIGEVARNLYAGLRAVDAAGVEVILIAEPPAGGLGDAVVDRLRRASQR